MGIGLDFGTTNSSIALAGPTGAVSLASFSTATGSFTESYRSLLYLQRAKSAGRTSTQSWSGPQAIAQYLQADDEIGRLIQSLKSFLASRGLLSTEVFGRRIRLEDLVARILRDLRVAAESQFGGAMESVVVGRPVRFVGAESSADDEYALARLKSALETAGFTRVSFEYEPIAAAYYYEATLDRDELILIGDFGGGTSDFSLLNVGPSCRKREAGSRSVLGNEGLGLAGDAFDARIVRRLVSPELGAGTELRSGHKLLPVPGWVYSKLERWHYLSLLKSQETLNMLQSVAVQAVEPDKIRRLIYLVKHDLGYRLHRAVQALKVELSRSELAQFSFEDGDVELSAVVRRADFESWIAEDLEAISASVDALLQRTGVPAAAVDRVFLTGGSSFVPAVRRIFESRFGGGKIRTGDEFTSVARGLALRSLDAR